MGVTASLGQTLPRPAVTSPTTPTSVTHLPKSEQNVVQGNMTTLDELCNHCEQLVQDLQEKEKKTSTPEHKASKTGNGKAEKVSSYDVNKSTIPEETESDESSSNASKLSALDGEKLHFVSGLFPSASATSLRSAKAETGSEERLPEPEV